MTGWDYTASALLAYALLYAVAGLARWTMGVTR